MASIYQEERMEYGGRSYFKSASGLWLEMRYKGKDKSSFEERKIKNFAKRVAKTKKKPTSTIKMPFERNIEYEVERNVKVTEGFFIFKSTRMDKVRERRAGTKVDYRDVPVDGWILKTYYENCDVEIDSNCREKDSAKWFYVLKRDGSLVVLQIGYVITSPETNWEKARIYHGVTEEPMTFDFDRAGLGSAYLLDFKPILWKIQTKRTHSEMLYFMRNYPIKMGQNESKGESYLIQEAGRGIMEALKKLDTGHAKR